MQLKELQSFKTARTTYGRPTSTLTDKDWQNQFSLAKLYITPSQKNNWRMSESFARECVRTESANTYSGRTNWQSYCAYINDILNNIRSGAVDYCYYGYQIIDLLRFHRDTLRTKYRNGYWEVWLEEGVKECQN